MQFWIELLGAGVRFATGVLGVFFIVTGLHGIAFGPSINALSGYDGAIVSGTLDFHLLRPRSTQVLVSVARWTPLMGVEVIIGSVLVARALASLGSELSAWQIVVFICALFMSVSILYSLTLSTAAWSADSVAVSTTDEIAVSSTEFTAASAMEVEPIDTIAATTQSAPPRIDSPYPLTLRVRASSSPTPDARGR